MFWVLRLFMRESVGIHFSNLIYCANYKKSIKLYRIFSLIVGNLLNLH